LNGYLSGFERIFKMFQMRSSQLEGLSKIKVILLLHKKKQL
jgi:hypothetical protein